ncbi:recombination regulator RecX [Clostridium tyrobutyricum]|jgi:regulatory protein|uniref:recombination regulator RecX n=1 Tax=Clostridium tyrobutyricum TaxID=1519 RepID=UPI0003188155|nr:recombination regulator RecX [Clostridium tyrobutyricum]MBR9648003.1 recombination regulator RecX [Clostridium tyrobutyricum]MBV4424518.1 recombination regulator RecX [Clostridium tyrobutyricum]MBV4430199.1 recombination regulator RecX [Clostridium tyrobutyricum]MBV4450132.1 recombination regulator RecX [Clostridium tyrobutyricum]MEA5007401.1 recombination regulator RecX [Clostridium tyrobutyricum]
MNKNNINLVTDIKVQKGNKNRVNVYIDYEFSFSCSRELVYRYRIDKNEYIDLGYIKGIIHEDNYIKCKSSALNILERNYKTEKQISDKLLKKGYDIDTVLRTLNFLKDYKFVDDNKFASLYAEEKIRICGRNKIKHELVKKGIEKCMIDRILSDMDKGQYEENALNCARKKYDIIIKSENNFQKVYLKLGSYLTRRGYETELAKNILKKIIKKDDFIQQEKISKKDTNPLYDIAKKRYNIITRSENDINKINRRLSQYLMRRGYLWEDIKQVLRKIMQEDI